MTLKLFLAICILGLDVLIYFLFQWTLGEKRHSPRRRSKPATRVENGQETALYVVHAQKPIGRKRAKVLQYPRSASPKRTWSNNHGEPSECVTEEMAHRRRAAAFAASK